MVKKKSGEVTWELVRTLLFVTLLVTMIIIAIVLFKGKGGDLLDSVMKILRFGRRGKLVLLSGLWRSC